MHQSINIYVHVYTVTSTYPFPAILERYYHTEDRSCYPGHFLNDKFKAKTFFLNSYTNEREHSRFYENILCG